MTEDFLHYIWRTKSFKTSPFVGTQKELIQVLDYGNYNTNAGPDFLEGKAIINGQLWAGQIELHVSSSDWYKHKHQTDDAYKNVILHVVYYHDKEVLRENGEAIPTVVLQGNFDESLYWKYEQLLQGERFIPCENQLDRIDDFTKIQQYDKWLVERLADKSAWLLAEYHQNGNDWNTVFYRAIMYAFGLKVNAESFLALATKLPLKILEKHKSNLFQLEALLFGVAGLLADDFKEEYPKSLKSEFEFLCGKYDLQSLEKTNWKFARMRPQGFPSIRLAQLAKIFHHSFPDFNTVVAQGNLEGFYQLFNHEPSAYWENHFVFGKESKAITKTPGKATINRMITNAIAPLLFCYATVKNEPFYKQRALDVLDQLPAEKNSITKKLATLGFSNQNGFESQAILEMYKNYCRHKKCLNCAIANKLLRL